MVITDKLHNFIHTAYQVVQSKGSATDGGVVVAGGVVSFLDSQMGLIIGACTVILFGIRIFIGMQQIKINNKILEEDDDCKRVE